jgi:hypothetical protein
MKTLKLTNFAKFVFVWMFVAIVLTLVWIDVMTWMIEFWMLVLPPY